ncbi:MAG: 4a-hydroxytetrahydrobiopterin dehydratase [Deinococcales bacterium]
MAQTLDDATIRNRLASLDGWSLQDGKLHREYRFDDFSSAFGFLSRVALLAEKHNHHPDIQNSYSRVVLELVSHDAGGVTEADLEMAGAIQALA